MDYEFGVGCVVYFCVVFVGVGDCVFEVVVVDLCE